MAGLAALTTLLPQHLKLHYFALYADVKEPFEALRFEPVYLNWFFQSNNRENSKRGVTKMVGLIGLEPMTPALSRRCSNQLSYRPVIGFHDSHSRFPRVETNRERWWRLTDSNR